MHEILCIVQNNRRKIGLLFNFILTQRVPEVIEAIRLRGWSVLSTDYQPNIVNARRCSRNGSNRFTIIWITTDVDTKYARCPLLQASLQHGAYHSCLLPGWHEYRQAAIRRRIAQCFDRCPLVTRIDKQSAPQTVNSPHSVKN